jgi:3-hydroxyacyl-CoA dehydrogenase
MQILHMKNVSVIGAGTMGNGIAHVFAQSGFAVNYRRKCYTVGKGNTDDNKKFRQADR